MENHNGIVSFSPGPADVHCHPRVFAPLNMYTRQDGLTVPVGKAGLEVYTETMLRSGLTYMGAMSNEFLYVRTAEDPDVVALKQFPISTPDRATIVAHQLETYSAVEATLHFGVSKDILSEDGTDFDRARLRQNFSGGGDLASALKIFADISTGGQNIPKELIPEMKHIWHEYHPNKPVILHVEGEGVADILRELATTEVGRKIPVHIAHVSSQVELEAVIEAKQREQNVTCEVTPHHLFTFDEEVEPLGGYGCMKPSIKRREDMLFIRAHLESVDMIASDCAPHQESEKKAENPAFGVTNHTPYMHLLFGAVEEGWMTLEDVYQKTVVAPRARFNIPDTGRTSVVFDLNRSPTSVEEVEKTARARYGENLFLALERAGRSSHLAGVLLHAASGTSRLSRDHGVLEENIKHDMSHALDMRRK